MASDVKFVINIKSPIAVYVQIENQVQFAIASGRFKPGDTLPSVREMSEVLDVNPNTITKSYRDLELMQLVHTRRGVGVTVSEKAPKICREMTRNMVIAHLRESVAECNACGFSASEIRKIVSETLDSGLVPYMSTDK